MEESGPRADPARPLIIERPDLQSGPQRLLSTALTVGFWVLYAYLWLPVLGLLGWAFGVSRFYEEMVRLEGYRPLLQLLGWYGLVVGLLAGSLIAWASWNYRRFRHMHRRAAPRPVGLDQIAGHGGVEPARLLLWQRARVLTVHHDEDGRIVDVRPHGAPPPERIGAVPATGAMR